MDYKFGTKNNWRRWQWNRMGERIQNKNGTILYLAAIEDIDRSVAKDKGFKNLVAVSLDGSVCSSIRRRGGIAISENISTLIIAWPPDDPLVGIVADFCCGFNRTPLDLMTALCISEAINEEIPVSLNLQRGRDPQSNFIRQCFQTVPGVGNDELKNRSFQVLVYWLSLCIGPKDAVRPDFDEFGSALWGRMQPEFKSYKSSAGVVMDGVVFQFIPEVFNITHLPIRNERTRLIEKYKDIQSGPHDPMEHYSAARRKISAMKAMKTVSERGSHGMTASHV